MSCVLPHSKHSPMPCNAPIGALAQWSLDRTVAQADLTAFEALTATHAELSERDNILPFLRAHADLSDHAPSTSWPSLWSGETAASWASIGDDCDGGATTFSSTRTTSTAAPTTMSFESCGQDLLGQLPRRSRR